MRIPDGRPVRARRASDPQDQRLLPVALGQDFPPCQERPGGLQAQCAWKMQEGRRKMSETNAKSPARRTRKFKEEYVTENVLLKIRVHQLETDLAAYKARPFWSRVLNLTPNVKEVKP